MKNTAFKLVSCIKIEESPLQSHNGKTILGLIDHIHLCLYMFTLIFTHVYIHVKTHVYTQTHFTILEIPTKTKICENKSNTTNIWLSRTTILLILIRIISLIQNKLNI